jgi:hypothetical protein
MSELSLKTQHDLLVFIKENLSTDKNLSIRGLSRLCGINPTSLIKGGGFNSEKLGQKLIEYGFEAAGLTENGFDAKACWLVIEYYAYESKAKAPGAKQIARTFGEVGIMTTFDKLTEVPPPQPVELTQRLLNELYELIGIKCDYEADQDVIIREVVEYLRALNPKDRATLRMGLMSGYNRLECEADHDVQQNRCINMLVKRLRHVQGILEGFAGIARHLFPKIEQSDPENAHIINPSTKQHLLADVAQFKPDEGSPINEIDISRDLTIPSRNGNIKQYVPQLPASYVLDVPGIH